jgi:hypothetical protein
VCAAIPVWELVPILPSRARGNCVMGLFQPHRHELCKASEAEIASALYGNWRSELLFALKQTLHRYEFYQKQLRECERQIEACLLALKDKSDGRPLPPSLRKRKPEFSSGGSGAAPTAWRGRCGWRRKAAITPRMRWGRSTAAFKRGRAAAKRSWRRRGRLRSAFIVC